ncbi:MAG: hypothetical protein JW795_04030 [Chitinivibrionales bacterium]|nr:hypothetical protein [Chitinivibrionales bacterium]
MVHQNRYVFCMIAATLWYCVEAQQQAGQNFSSLFTVQNGNIGIGGVQPNSRFSLGTTFNQRLLGLHDDPKEWYGFGMDSATLRMQIGKIAGQFSFYAGPDHEIVTICGNGDVGIGTTTPNSRLALGTVQIPRCIGLLDVPGNWYGFGVNNNKMLLQIGSSRARFAFQAGDADELMTILGNGFVGIGTSSPMAALEIASLQRLNQYAFRFNPDVGCIGVNTDNTGLSLSGGRPEIGNSGGAIRLNGALMTGELRNTVQFFNASIEAMRITTNGSVGIGTTNPGLYKLAVEGTIGAREIIVTTNKWADYVFEEEYQLKPLADLEQYIAEHRHLPNIPDADSVQSKGVEIGTMQASLLANIEELTLYIIEQNKRIEALEQKNAQFEKRTDDHTHAQHE